MVASLSLGVPGVSRPQKQTSQAETMPGPVQGMNATANLYGMSPGEALFTVNLIPSEFGSRTRLGFKEWAHSMLGDGIRTIIPFDGSDSDHIADKLFAVTNTDIYDVTAGGAAVSKATFADQGAESGWGHFTHYVNDDGTDFLYAAFDLNGLYEYDSTLNTWAPATGITFNRDSAPDGTDEGDIVFVMSHKQRLWLIPQGASHAYYLPVGSKQGVATAFDFGNKFKHGGELVGLYNWSIDGGDGVDDYLVAISGGGDIIMYRGEDPALADSWTTTGTWYVGELPSGRRGVSEVGGDLWRLSTQGLITAQSLVSGVYTGDTKASPAAKITRLIRNRMYLEKNKRGWEVSLNANEAQFVINGPERAGQKKLQYIYSIPMNGWGLWRGVPAKTFGNWNGRFYIGEEGSDPKIWEMIGDLEYVHLDTEADGEPEPIDFTVLSSYQDFGKPALFKRVQYLRPYFVGNVEPLYDAKALYNYDITEPTLVPEPPAPGPGIWDTGQWDIAVWGGSLGTFDDLRGGNGIGNTIAYAIRGTATARTTLAAVDIVYDSGGPT